MITRKVGIRFEVRQVVSIYCSCSFNLLFDQIPGLSSDEELFDNDMFDILC